MKQPISGVLATTLIIVLAWLVVSLFDFATFTTWTAWLFMAMIPAQILVGVTWGANPAFAANLEQPLKGMVMLLFTLAVGCAVAAIGFFTVGGGISPPAPMLVVYTILTVIVMFWLAIMFGGWPFMNSVKSPIGGGLLMLLACYGISYLLFQVFFDFGFMRGAPVYVAMLDPGGLFNANSALAFIVTAIAVLFLLLHFDLWPLTTVPALMRQPVLGLAWTALAVAVGGLAMYVGVAVMGMDPMLFMVRVPIPLIFGTIVVLNMLQNSLFASLVQPLKGFCNAFVAIVLGSLLAALYGLLAPLLTGTLATGAPGNDYERWLASALLGVTFPLLIFFAEYFRLWPFAEKPRT
jgi:hypothetical protein